MTDFWTKLRENRPSDMRGMAFLVSGEITAMGVAPRDGAKLLLGAASDEDLKALAGEEKYLFLRLMRVGNAPVDAAEYQLRGRLYACHEMDDITACMVRETSDSLRQFMSSAEFANMRAFWPQISGEERLACLGSLVKAMCHGFGFPEPQVQGVANLGSVGKYFFGQRVLQFDMKALESCRLDQAIHLVAHETTHAWQDHLGRNAESLPKALREHALLFACNYSHYIPPSADRALYRAQPLEKIADDMAGFVVSVLDHMGMLPVEPSPAAAAGAPDSGVFWENLKDFERHDAKAMRAALEREIAAMGVSAKEACKALATQATDEDLKALKVPAKYAFMAVMKGKEPVDDAEYAIWARMYACHEGLGMAPHFAAEIGAAMRQFTDTAEFANMRAFWPQMSGGERLACLRPVVQGICENFGVLVPELCGGDLGKSVAGRFSPMKKRIEVNVGHDRLQDLSNAVFAVAHESVHAVQRHMAANRGSLPRALQKQAEVFFWNQAFYIPGRLGKIYECQPMERQANDVAAMMVLFLRETGFLPVSQKKIPAILHGVPVPGPVPSGRT